MPQLPEFFATQHNLHELAVVDEAPSSTLFAVEDGATHQPLSVEIFAPGITGMVEKSTALHGLHHPAIAPLVGTGTTADGQEFIVREGFVGVPNNLSRADAAEIFGPLAGAVDFLISRKQADFAVHGLREARVGVDKHRHPIGDEHLERGDHSRLGQGVGVAADEDGAADGVSAAVIHDGLRGGQDVRLVERVVQRGPAVPGGAEADLLVRVLRVDVARVISRDQRGDVDQVSGLGELTSAFVCHVRAPCVSVRRAASRRPLLTPIFHAPTNFCQDSYFYHSTGYSNVQSSVRIAHGSAKAA